MKSKFWMLVALLVVISTIAAQCAAPATVVVTKEVEVEKEVIVTKEVEVEKEVVVTKEVEVEKEVEVGGELIKALLEVYDVKEVCIFSESQLNGLMVGLYGKDDRYLGFGLLRSINVERKSVTVYTPVEEDVGRVEFGEIRLDDEYRESVARVP